MRVLVTGASGFVGPHLARELADHGHRVVGFDRAEPSSPIGDLDAMSIGDVRDHAAVTAAVAEQRPDAIIHLAGAASVGASFGAPIETFHLNVDGTLAILEAVRGADRPIRTICVTSAEIYGAVAADELPVDEESSLAPHSPYGASKAAADIVALQYRRGYGLDVLTVRPFNHIGPGQGPRFVVPSIARQIALAEQDPTDRITLQVGNVDARRDFLDVRDVVRAYRLVLERGGAHDTYVVGRGSSRSVGELIAMLTALARKPVDVVRDPALLRPGEPLDLYCSPARLHAETGWEPRYDLETTLKDTLDWWRGNVAEGRD